MASELLLPKTIKQILAENQLRPLKRRGQNFLVSSNVLEKIIRAADLKTGDIVLEIGAGLGSLTMALAEKVCPGKKDLSNRKGKVIAIEKDKKLVPLLKQNIKDFRGVTIVEKDCLDYEPGMKNYKIVANLPYYLAAAVIRKFLEAEQPPRQMVLMVQKEMAQRIIAQPPAMNRLAVSVQFYAKAEIISSVSSKCFWPEPKVESAIIKLTANPPAGGQKSGVNKEVFFKIVKAGFAQPRKQLVNNLSSGLKLEKDKIIFWLGKNKIKPSQRAQELTLSDWLNLSKTLPL